MQEVLKITNLTKDYGNQKGIFDLNLEVRPGELLGFLGPNGAGKTTTIRIIMDLIHANHGQVEIFGTSSRYNIASLNRRIGYLPGALKLYEDMKGESLIEYFGYLRKGIDWDYVETLSARFRAELKRNIKTLSAGNKQKLGIIQAFMHQPELLILDEPTSGLDPLMQVEFYELLKEVQAKGTTIFMSSHNLPEVERVCERVVIIKEGRLVSTEAIGDLKKLATRHFEVEFAEPVDEQDFSKLKGVTEITVKDRILSCQVVGNVDEFIKTLAKYKVSSFKTKEASLESIFLHYYEVGDDA